MNYLSKSSPMLRAGVISTAGLLAASLLSPAHAHHPFGMGDSTNLTALQGLLSGIGHPLLGPDHLLFLLAIALIGLPRPRTWVLPLLAAGLSGSVLSQSPTSSKRAVTAASGHEGCHPSPPSAPSRWCL